jgi:tetratricopeptide (TPR) repeat protein
LQSQNKKFLLATVVATAAALVGFNLDVPGKCLLAAGRADIAMPCYQLMTSFANDLHISNERTADALNNLADCYAKNDRMDDAVKVEQQSINMYRTAVGPDSTPVFLALAKLGEYLNARGNYVRAEMILSDAVQGLERAQVPDTAAVAHVYATLGDTLAAQGKNYQAIAVFEKLLPVDERLMMQTQQSVDSYDRLAAVYGRLGRVNLSKQTMEAGIAIKERILGANNVQVATSQRKLAELAAER